MTTQPQEPIKAKVAKILSIRELMINKGKNDGVKVGMVFKIIAKDSIEIFDPDTKKSLGFYDREKIKVKVTQVFDLMAVCSTFKEDDGLFSTLRPTSLSTILSQDNSPTLKTADSIVPEPLSESDSYINIGDNAISLPNNSK